MSFSEQPGRRRFRTRRPAICRPCVCELGAERLEDRCLLSGGFVQIDLASDVPGLAQVTDRNLINPWGMAFSLTGPFWFADNGSGVSNVLDGRGERVPLTVTVPATQPSRAQPTGTVFNGGSGFAITKNGISAPSRFLFATEDGLIAGWTAVVDSTNAVLAVDNSSSGAVYTGLALGADAAGQPLLYAADFHHGEIAVFDQDFTPVTRSGAFQDPDIPREFSPLNIQNIDNQLFVTYAELAEGESEEVAGEGKGFVDVYDTAGKFLKRFASGGALNAPWGLAAAPPQFGAFEDALLIGNNGDGRIGAYDLATGAFLGELADDDGDPLVVPELWALTFGNGHMGGDRDTLFFTAGIGDEDHGLFGAIQSPQRRGADTAGPGAFDPNVPGEPDDYPLPPNRGPTLKQRNDSARLVTPVLLPSRESSLTMLPTLSVVSQPTATGVAPVATDATSAGSVRFHGSPNLLVSSTDEPGATAYGFRKSVQNPLPLSAFLDVSAVQTSPDAPARQRQGTDAIREITLARRWSSADRNDFAEKAGDDLHMASEEIESSTEPVHPLAPSGPLFQLPAWTTLQDGVAPDETLASGTAAVPTQERGKWIGLLNGLLTTLGVIALYASGRKHRSSTSRLSLSTPHPAFGHPLPSRGEGRGWRRGERVV